jgi:hypothetical protein
MTQNKETDPTLQNGDRLIRSFTNELAQEDKKKAEDFERCGCSSCMARANKIYQWWAVVEYEKTGVVYKKKRG